MEDTTHDSGLEHAERLFARGFVIAGGAFWMVAAFAGPYVYGGAGLGDSLKTAMWPFLATVATLIIGWVYERLAAVLLFAASAAVPVWGVLYGWELGVWVIMSVVLIAPMALAGILFTLSSRAEAKRMEASEPRHSASEKAVRTPASMRVQVRPR